MSIQTVYAGIMEDPDPPISDSFMLGYPLPKFTIQTDAQKGLIEVLNRALHMVPRFVSNIRCAEGYFSDESVEPLNKAIDLDAPIPKSRKKLQQQLKAIKDAYRFYLEEAKAFRKLLQYYTNEELEFYRFIFRVLMEAIKDPSELQAKLDELRDWIHGKTKNSN